MTSFTNSTRNYPTGADTPIHRVRVNRPPTTSDRKNFILGDEWLDTSGDNWWKLVTITANSAVWKRFANAALDIDTITGDSGGAVGPDASNNLNLLGTAGQITVAGNSGTNTLTLSLANGGTPMDSFVPDSGTNPVVPTAAGVVTMAGSGSITTVGGLNSLTTQLTGLTNHAVLVGAGTTTITKIAATANTGAVLQNNSGADPSYSTATYPSTTTINQILYSSAANTVAGLATANRSVLTTGATGIPVLTALATDGQLIIGSTAGVPAAATLTAGSGVSITNGSNSITIGLTGGGTAIDSFTPDSGTTPVVPDGAGNVAMTGGNGIATVGGTNTLTFDMESPFTGDFTFQSTTSGDTETLTVTNTSDTASSQAQVLARVAGASAGDAFVTYTVTGVTSWSHGVDNSDSDKWKLSQGAVLGTNDVLTATTAGLITVPLGNFEVTRSDATVLPMINCQNTHSAQSAIISCLANSPGSGFYSSGVADDVQFWNFGVVPSNAGTNARGFNISYNTVGQADPSGGSTWLRISTAGAVTFANAYTFPTTDGSAGQTLVTNGAGVLTFQNAGSTGWTVIGANQTLAVNEGYICTTGAALSLALPAVSAVGDEIEVALNGSTSWTITQPNAGTQIRIGTSTTTLGVGGSLASTSQGDSIRLVCVTANATWMVVSVVGNITVV